MKYRILEKNKIPKEVSQAELLKFLEEKLIARRVIALTVELYEPDGVVTIKRKSGCGKRL